MTAPSAPTPPDGGRVETTGRRPSERLIADLVDKGHLSAGSYRIERTYAGYWQRTEGAWSWYVVQADTGLEAFIGSQWPVTRCLRGYDFADGSLIPLDVKEPSQ